MFSNRRPAILAGRSFAERLIRASAPLAGHVFGLLIDGRVDHRRLLSSESRVALGEALAEANGQRVGTAENQVNRIVARTLEFAELLPLFPRRCEGLYEIQADCTAKELFDQACASFQDGLNMKGRALWDQRTHGIMITVRDRIDAMKVDALRLIELMSKARELERAQMGTAALRIAERRIEEIIADIPELEKKRTAIAKSTLDITTAALV